MKGGVISRQSGMTSGRSETIDRWDGTNGRRNVTNNGQGCGTGKRGGVAGEWGGTTNGQGDSVKGRSGVQGRRAAGKAV